MSLLSASETIALFTEISVALTGFAGVASAFAGRNRELTRLDRVRMPVRYRALVERFRGLPCISNSRSGRSRSCDLNSMGGSGGFSSLNDCLGNAVTKRPEGGIRKRSESPPIGRAPLRLCASSNDVALCYGCGYSTPTRMVSGCIFAPTCPLRLDVCASTEQA